MSQAPQELVIPPNREHSNRIFKLVFIIVLVVMFLSLVLLSTVLKQQWRQNQRLMASLQKSYATNTELLQKEQEITPNVITDSNRRKYGSDALTERLYQNELYIAYALETPETFSHPSFIIEKAGYPLVLSNAYRDFTQTALFDFYGSSLYVINAIDNNLAIYDMAGKKPKYVTAIALPNYRIGTVSGVTCHEEKCEINTALHQESGCVVLFNPLELNFDTPMCQDETGEFTPEEL